MAKKPTTKNKNIEWENKLPPVYRTLVDGFHSAMSVKEMLIYIGDDMADMPEIISHIKLKSFTPTMFKHPELVDFWRTPVSVKKLKEKNPSVHVALHDPHVRDVQKYTGYDFDPNNPTREDLARLVSSQELGLLGRMGQLVRDTLLNRLEKLRQPEFYNKLRNSTFVTQHKLQALLPKDPPSFKVMKNEFNVKDIKSAQRKAYADRGKDKGRSHEVTLANFLSDHEEYGTARVRDMLRTSIDIPREGIPRSELHKRYTDIRNILFVAMNSGELGMTCNEFVDSVNYPPTSKPKDLYPTGNVKGEFYHAGINGSLLSVPLEIQIPYMPNYVIDRTHDNMKRSRELDPNIPKDREEQKELELERCETYDSTLPAPIKEKRKTYLDGLGVKAKILKSIESDDAEKITEEDRATLMEFSRVLTDDKIGAMIVNDGFHSNSSDIGFDSQVVKRRAGMVALAEYPEEEKAAYHKMKKGSSVIDTITKIEPSRSDLFRATMAVLVQEHPIAAPAQDEPEDNVIPLYGPAFPKGEKLGNS